jgi:hypothetical protein
MQIPAPWFPTSRPVEPHLVAKLSLHTSSMVKIIREDDVISVPSLSCEGIKLSHRVGHWLGNVRLTLGTKESASVKRGSAILIMGQESADIPFKVR